MTTNRPTPDAPSAEDAARARELRRASELVEEFAEPGRARTSILHQLGLMIANLAGMPARDCRACGSRFGFSQDEIEFYRSRSLSMPTHCQPCRKRRYDERSKREQSIR